MVPRVAGTNHTARVRRGHGRPPRAPLLHQESCKTLVRPGIRVKQVKTGTNRQEDARIASQVVLGDQDVVLRAAIVLDQANQANQDIRHCLTLWCNRLYSESLKLYKLSSERMCPPRCTHRAVPPALGARRPISSAARGPRRPATPTRTPSRPRAAT
jgi:hypothetical protein